MTLQDAQLTLAAYTAALSGSAAAAPECTDIDCDGAVTVTDAQYILCYYVCGLVDENAVWSAVDVQFPGLPLTPEDAGNALFGDYYYEAARTLTQMTAEEKVSQIFLVSYPGYAAATAEVQSEKCPAGYVLFAADFQYQTPASLTPQMEQLKKLSPCGLLLGCDEEGGGVVRASCFPAFRSSAFLSPQTLFRLGGMERVLADAEEKALFLRDLGLNYNFAPVADMPQNPNSYIYGRSLGQDAETTAAFTAGTAATMRENGLLSMLKHFPGYGDNLDTHKVVSVDRRTKAEFEAADLVPFVSGIEAGAPMIMVNHNIIACMDDVRPASLSAEVHRYLREELGFTGLILTDALTMGAVLEYADGGEAAVQAVLCGNDVLVTKEYAAEREEVMRAVESGRIPEVLINDAARRILACKMAYGLV